MYNIITILRHYLMMSNLREKEFARELTRLYLGRKMGLILEILFLITGLWLIISGKIPQRHQILDWVLHEITLRMFKRKIFLLGFFAVTKSLDKPEHIF
jgi:hypothetical protein